MNKNIKILIIFSFFYFNLYYSAARNFFSKIIKSPKKLELFKNNYRTKNYSLSFKELFSRDILDQLLKMDNIFIESRKLLKKLYPLFIKKNFNGMKSEILESQFLGVYTKLSVFFIAKKIVPAVFIYFLLKYIDSLYDNYYEINDRKELSFDYLKRSLSYYNIKAIAEKSKMSTGEYFNEDYQEISKNFVPYNKIDNENKNLNKTAEELNSSGAKKAIFAAGLYSIVSSVF